MYHFLYDAKAGIVKRKTQFQGKVRACGNSVLYLSLVFNDIQEQSTLDATKFIAFESLAS